jgi:endonuclease III
MPTRAAAAREAAFLEAATQGGTPIHSESNTNAARLVKAQNCKSTKRKGQTTAPITPSKESVEGSESGQDVMTANEEETATSSENVEDLPPTPANTGKKRKSTASASKKEGVVRREPVKGGWDELPHGIGKIEVGETGSPGEVTESYEDSGVPPKKRARTSVKVKTEELEDGRASAAADPGVEIKAEEMDVKPLAKKRNLRGKAKTAQPVTPESSDHMDVDPITEELKEEFKDEFREDVKNLTPGSIKTEDVKEEKPKRKRASRAKKVDTSRDVQDKVNDLLDATDTPAKKPKKGKANPYGLTPGQSPFPDFVMPTPEACKEVEDLLAEIHGKVEAPKEIPAPSLEVTGCGEVPSVLDALIRTRLSASTTSQNAKYAFQGLVERYGIRTEGIGAGSVDWNKVRESDVLEIEKAIKKGGLAKTKSISIKKILEMVHEQNIARRDAFIKARDGGDLSHIVGADRMSQGQKDMEIGVADQKVLSLDYMHGLTADEAMTEFVKFPGIGVKTASCVILFCLQRPSFAVDTHVWRLCKWLKWVPEGANRDQTFSHCEVRVPNEMKYSLHQLFIRHGKTCGKCRAITGETSEVWEATVCPIEHLVERTGKKKGGPPPRKPLGKGQGAGKKGGKGKKAKKGQDSEEDEDSELTDLSDAEEPEVDDNDSEDANAEE